MPRSILDRFDRSLRAHIADVGMTVFIGTSVLIVLVTLAEAVRPGIAASYIPSQGLFVVAALSAAASLLSPVRGKRTLRHRLTYGAVAVAVTYAVALIAWRQFGPLEDARLGLTAAAVTIAVLLFVSMARMTEPAERM